MGLFDRISKVFSSNINAMVSAAEDPEKMLEQALIDMNEDLVSLRQAVAQAIASQKRLEQQYNTNQQQASEWERRAKLALTKGDEALALEALNRKKTNTETALALKAQLEQSAAQVATLKKNMTALEGKISEAKTKKDMLIARARAAKASEQIQKVVGNINTSSSAALFERMENKVLEQEARSEAIAELSGSALESQFAQLESGDVNDELEALKRQIAGTPSTTGALPAASSPFPVDASSSPASYQSPVPSDPDIDEIRRALEKN